MTTGLNEFERSDLKAIMATGPCIHLHNVEKDDKHASKPVARHLNLPNHSILFSPYIKEAKKAAKL